MGEPRLVEYQGGNVTEPAPLSSMKEYDRTLITSDGAGIAYRIWRGAAKRRLLVLIHGLASNMTRWSEFVERTSLKESWDILRLDLRGEGRSLVRGVIRMEEWCSDLAAILEAEGYARAVLAGHCLGAHIAVQFASRYPERTTGLVLIEPLLSGALTSPQRRYRTLTRLSAPAVWGVRLLNRLGLRRRHFPLLDLRTLDRDTRAAMSASKTHQAMLSLYASPLYDLRFMPVANYTQGLRELYRPLPSLAGIRKPALVLLSTGKLFSDPAMTQTLLAELPMRRVVVLDSHHWIPTERPDDMRATIEQWCGELK